METQERTAGFVKNVVWLGAAPFAPVAPPGGFPSHVKVHQVPLQPGWASAWAKEPPVLVVLWVVEPMAWDALKELAGTPTVAVLTHVDAQHVAALRRAGVNRVLLAEEFGAQWPTLLRAVV